MRFVCDEGVERHVVDDLRSGGHAVVYVAELSPGISDDEVLELAIRDGALLVTSDKEKGELVSAAVAERGVELQKAFSVVEPGRIRIRRHGVE